MALRHPKNASMYCSREQVALAMSSTGLISLLWSLSSTWAQNNVTTVCFSCLVSRKVGLCLVPVHLFKHICPAEPIWVKTGRGRNQTPFACEDRRLGWTGSPGMLRVPVGCSFWAHPLAYKLGSSVPRCLRFCRCSAHHAESSSTLWAAGQAMMGLDFVGSWMCVGFGRGTMHGGGRGTTAS